ncbi:STAS domain-containing protein [Sneathiella sp.]|uniref:STAS domain-containing protein n=1 Tax=Sneathiella sp. TaxID=1964365 RepID=UPI00262402CE|nr:STAS domain-containing protein [Sneathiella sp.]MDF2366611.1 STAS domain-containing protein [Sneathiella sp.]
MKISINIRRDIVTVKIAGTVDSHVAGRLYDALVQCVGSGKQKLIIDLSGVQLMTRAGMRGLVVAARLMKSNRGNMRICGAQKSVEAVLQNLGYNHLFNLDPTHQNSIDNLCEARGRKARDTAKVIPFGSTILPRPEGQCPIETEYYRSNPVIWRWELS